uniref:YnbE family lipoprotein n=1 Tax=Sphingomonas bacterium TaxID=1895847 RepID=UPI0026360FDD|nr:YnbE family lipoprotein [Sphingomonas bacterium]
MNRMIAIAALAAAGMTGGCVNVTAPDKPIVINLNINITQEVVYRLDGEAKTAIQQNPGIF